MRYRLLGKSGLRVSELCLGTANFGRGSASGGLGKAESAVVFEAFAGAGGNFVDTSNRYGRGESEERVGEFLASERDRFVLASKYTLATRAGDPNAGGNHRKSLVRALEGSLRRLDTDYLDLYLVHAWDATVPVEELMRALDDVVRAGKVLHVGVSNAPAWIVSRANTLAELRGWSPFVNLQIEYSLVQREPERELLPMAEGLGLGVTAYSPLGAGWLAGDVAEPGRVAPEGAYRLAKVGPAADQRNARIAQEAGAVAREAGCPVSHVALAWLRERSPGVIPIVGAESGDQMSENLGALRTRLSPAQRERLDLASRIDLGYPHDLLAREDTRERLYGDLHDRLDTD
jgi:aryl-alcohol dehydrogenase-like predicted oxidoreductase